MKHVAIDGMDYALVDKISSQLASELNFRWIPRFVKNNQEPTFADFSSAYAETGPIVTGGSPVMTMVSDRIRGIKTKINPLLLPEVILYLSPLDYTDRLGIMSFYKEAIQAYQKHSKLIEIPYTSDFSHSYIQKLALCALNEKHVPLPFTLPRPMCSYSLMPSIL